MTCCGKKLAQSAKKIASIAEGNVQLFVDQYFRLPSKQCPMARQRRQACRTNCQNGTWMGRFEFAWWVHRNGGFIKFLAEIDDLTGWPMPPKQPYKNGTVHICRICKCWIAAKSMVESERCPVGNPAWETTDLTAD